MCFLRALLHGGDCRALCDPAPVSEKAISSDAQSDSRRCCFRFDPGELVATGQPIGIRRTAECCITEDAPPLVQYCSNVFGSIAQIRHAQLTLELIS